MGTMSITDVTGHCEVLTNISGDVWQQTQQTLRADGILSITVNGDPERTAWERKDVQYGRNQVVRIEYIA